MGNPYEPPGHPVPHYRQWPRQNLQASLRDWLGWAEARIQDEDAMRLSPEALFEAVASIARESTADEW